MSIFINFVYFFILCGVLQLWKMQDTFKKNEFPLKWRYGFSNSFKFTYSWYSISDNTKELHYECPLSYFHREMVTERIPYWLKKENVFITSERLNIVYLSLTGVRIFLLLYTLLVSIVLFFVPTFSYEVISF